MELSLQSFHELSGIIRHESGIVLGTEKAYLVRHRLEPLVRSEGLDGFDELVKKLRMRNGMGLCNVVIDAITVKETQFFRDPSCFNRLLHHVLPPCVLALKNPARGRQRIRIWSAAAATGQEAYSVAMLLQEFIATSAEGVKESQFSILGSDISAAAIELAKAAKYSNAEVQRGLSEVRLRQHFHRRGERWIISEPVRRLVQFRTFNLLNPPAELGAFDLILCRNVLIYFDDATRRRICRGLYSVLQDGGWLVLGSAESLYGMEERFETLIHGKTILYRKPYG